MRSILFLPLAACLGFSQTQDTPESMQRLLAETAQNYRNAKSMLIEREIVETSDGDLAKDWSRSYSKDALREGDRLLSESRSVMFWSINITNGSKQWDWRPWRKQYTELPRIPLPPLKGYGIAQEGLPLFLAQLDSKLAGGTLLPPETLDLAGGRADCLVLIGPPGAPFDPTFKAQTKYWIDRDRKLLVKEEFTLLSVIPERRYRAVTVKTYNLNQLNEPLPDSLFEFHPPQGAVQITNFDFAARDLTGKPAPPLKLKTLNGEDFDLASLKGKPVLLDFWATWCTPCRTSLPALANLHTQLKDKGLTVIGVDEDDDPMTAARYVADNHYSWLQLFDNKLATFKDWGAGGIPRFVLIAKDGKVVYEGYGDDEEEQARLKAALQTLDSNFTLAKD